MPHWPRREDLQRGRPGSSTREISCRRRRRRRCMHTKRIKYRVSMLFLFMHLSCTLHELGEIEREREEGGEPSLEEGILYSRRSERDISIFVASASHAPLHAGAAAAHAHCVCLHRNGNRQEHKRRGMSRPVWRCACPCRKKQTSLSGKVA